MEYIKFCIKYLVRLLLHIFYLVPVDANKFYFSSFRGRYYSCNPKYLYESLLNERKETKLKCIWDFESLSKASLVPEAVCVKAFSLKSILAMMTSRYIIVNTEFAWWIPLRKNQTLLQTWHGGGAYKKVGLAVGWGKLEDLSQRLSSRQISFYISSSKKFTEVMASSKHVTLEKFINTGMPRNSIFFSSCKDISKKVYGYFSLNENIRLALYAPTYRGTPTFHSDRALSKIEAIDFVRVKNALESRFGGAWCILFRVHYYDAKLLSQNYKSIIDATEYDDMQELLGASSALITDYSSSIWDYSITQKPLFLFMPDLNSYEKQRSFYTEPQGWPGAISLTNDELIKNIENFDAERHERKCKKHLESFGSYEQEGSCLEVWKRMGVI